MNWVMALARTEPWPSSDGMSAYRWLLCCVGFAAAAGPVLAFVGLHHPGREEQHSGG